VRRYTIVMHDYIGYGSYNISFRRIRCKPEACEERMRDVSRGVPHFLIPGWPEIQFADGEPYFTVFTGRKR
jgi:hypothetical protein